MSRAMIALSLVFGLATLGAATAAPRVGPQSAAAAKNDTTVRKTCTCRICMDTVDGRCKIWASEERPCPCTKR